MFKGKTKIVVIFLASVLIMAFIIFIPQTEKQKTDEDSKFTETKTSNEQMSFTYEEGLTDQEQKEQQDDLKNKEAWCYYGENDIFEELWLFKKNDEYVYSLWKGNNQERNVSGHYKRNGDKLIYWLDGKEVKGEFKDGKLVIENKVFSPLTHGE